MSDELKPITTDPLIMGGEPCIGGTRIPVRAVASFASEGVEVIKREYPTLTDRQIADALAYALTRPTSADYERGLEDAAQRLQDHMEQHHGVCLRASQWDAAIRALKGQPND